MRTRTFSTRDEWLGARREGIGASEAAAILGEHPWKSRYQLWAEKTGAIEADDLAGNEPAEFGIRLEKPIAEAYADRTERRLIMPPPFTLHQHEQYDWMLATPDAFQESDDSDSPWLLQIKTCNAFKSKDWADEPPIEYQIQVQHEMAVCNCEWATLVVLIGGQRLRYFDVARNNKFIAALIEQEQRFWEMVQRGTPPEVDASKATTSAIAKLFPFDDGESVALPPEAIGWDDRMREVNEQIEKLEWEKALLMNQLKAAIGTHTVGMLPNGQIWTFKTQTRREHIVKESTFRVLRRKK